VTHEPVSANRLLVVLCAWFAVLFGVVIAIGAAYPDLLPYFPLGGNDVMEIVGVDGDDESFFDRLGTDQDVESVPASSQQIGMLALFLGLSLGGTVVVMLPVTWTYSAIKREVGYRKSFARALIVLPIIASTTVLLIQNNLALAFGLAAMVAAVRFRVALQEAIDGIFIFAAICVGLAAGIGHLGVATVMAFFFCVANTVLWKIDYGKNPVDDLRVAKKRAKLEGSTRPSDEF
jgi:hypothetical protein